MQLKVISYRSSEYAKMVELRYKVLRKPLGLSFSEDDLQRDEHDVLIVAFSDNTDQQIEGCCILSPTGGNDFSIQLRQMAVSDSHQGKGLGKRLLAFAESVAWERGYSCLWLHARSTAVDFYKQAGYETEGDLFTEVGIPHLAMNKTIRK